jgi:hypothetical protein
MIKWVYFRNSRREIFMAKVSSFNPKLWFDREPIFLLVQVQLVAKAIS